MTSSHVSRALTSGFLDELGEKGSLVGEKILGGVELSHPAPVHNQHLVAAQHRLHPAHTPG